MEQLIQDAESAPLPGEEGEEEGEGLTSPEELVEEEVVEEKGVATDPGSPAALFEQFVAKYVRSWEGETCLLFTCVCLCVDACVRVCACRLPMTMNRKLVDEMAVEFCMTLNAKIYRKRLAKVLYFVERNRSAGHYSGTSK